MAKRRKNAKHADLTPRGKVVRGYGLVPNLLGAGRGLMDNDADDHPSQVMQGTMPNCAPPTGGTGTGGTGTGT